MASKLEQASLSAAWFWQGYTLAVCDMEKATADDVPAIRNRLMIYANIMRRNATDNLQDLLQTYVAKKAERLNLSSKDVEETLSDEERRAFLGSPDEQLKDGPSASAEKKDPEGADE